MQWMTELAEFVMSVSHFLFAVLLLLFLSVAVVIVWIVLVHIVTKFKLWID